MKHASPPVELRLSGVHDASQLDKGKARVSLEDGHTLVREGSRLRSRKPVILSTTPQDGQGLRFQADGTALPFDDPSVVSTVADATTITNTAAEVDFSTTLSFSGRLLTTAGRTFRVRLFGHGQFDSVLRSNATIRIYLNATLLFSTTLALASSDVKFSMELLCVIRGLGPPLSILPLLAGGVVNASSMGIGTGASAAVNFTNAGTVTLKASCQWADADADNQITLQALVLEVL